MFKEIPKELISWVFKIRAKFVTVVIVLLITPLFVSFAQRHQEKMLHNKTTTVVTADERFKEIRSRIVDMVARGEIPSMAVAVAKDGKIIWEEAFGWADRENKIEATPNTIYALGSLSKSLMATGMMTLIEKGKVKLDDSVNRLISPAALTAYEGKASDVKVKHVLNLTAGIPHGWLSLDNWKDVPHTDEQKNEYARSFPIVVFPPGEVFEYSNFSMGIPELIIERVTKRPVAEYMKAEFFQPLGMNRTAVWLEPQMEHLAAVGYTSRNVRIANRGYRVPSGGLGFFSTAHDLIIYGMFQLKNHPPGHRQILSDKTLDLMHSYDQGPQGDYFTLGWFAHGPRIISNGSIGGANSHLTLIPSEGIAIVALTNMSSPNSIADQIAADIVAVISPTVAAAGRGGRQQHLQKFATPYKPTPELLGTWKGAIKAYGGDVPVTLIFNEEGEVQIQLQGQEKVNLEDVRFNSFKELRADFAGKIRTLESDQEALSSQMSITARLRDGRLYGYVSAIFTTQKGNFSLPSYVSLVKKN